MTTVITDRSEGYTVMGNFHFKDHSLSLKAMGLLSLLISLPGNWDFSMKGIASICKDGVDSVCAALTELEKAGYVQRRRIRDKNGRLSKIELTIMEHPNRPEPSENQDHSEKPLEAVPAEVLPPAVEPEQDFPSLENPRQLNTQGEIKKQENTYESNNHSFNQQPADTMNDGNAIRERVKKQIDYSCMAERYRRDQLNEIVEIMVEVAMNRSPTFRIGKDSEYATAFVQARFNLINALHIEHIMEGLRENRTLVRNTKAYLLKTIFNSVTTIENSCYMQHNYEYGSSW